MINQSAKMYFASQMVFKNNLKGLFLGASWVHGAEHIFYKRHSAQSYIHQYEFNLKRHLVANEDVLKYPGMNQFDAIAVGVPFLYTYPNIKKHHGTMFKRVYFPSHSIKNDSLADKYKGWIKTAKSYNCDAICLGGIDYSHLKKFFSFLDFGEIKLIEGAKICENNTLIKMKNIFYSIDECIVDFPGSHIIYAILCGCKIKFIENFIDDTYVTDRDINIANQYPLSLRAALLESFLSRIPLSDLIKKFASMNFSEKKEMAEFASGLKHLRSVSFLEKQLIPRSFKENFLNFNLLLRPKIKHKFLGDI